MSRKTILVVDDVEMNRAILAATFCEDFDILEANNGLEAMDIIQEKTTGLSAVLLDMVMPVMDGMEVLKEMKKQDLIEKIPVFLITADTSPQMMQKSYEMGVVDIIMKPITPQFIRKRIGNVIRLNCIIDEQEELIREKTAEVRELNRSLLEVLSTAVEFRSCESGAHVARMSTLTLFLIEAISEQYPEYRITKAQQQDIADAAVMHDVGKIAIPDSILNKPGRLTDEEYEIMKTHSVRGCELLESITKLKEHPIYPYAYDICRHHHERWDGRGYPDGLKGDEITIWSQAVSLADVYDALVSERVYKKAYSHEKAISMILNGECGQFNPKLLDCLRLVEKQIEERYRVE